MTGHASFSAAAAARHAVWVLAVLALCALAGCGFHLQGASPLPKGISSMYVSYHDNYRVGDPPVVAALKQRLRRQHLLGDADAPAQLDIVNVENSQRVVSVSPVDGNAAEYAVTTQVVFNYSVNGAEQLSGATLSTTRNYSVSANQRLSSEGERDELLKGMQQDLANLILERIAQANQKLDTSSQTGG
ncbi:LPS assembly lipoprotein LptE [Salinisphaera hydrothermalis]|uniref:LPS-assembly lipoprotein LptE n=1 Tax=Salinisphaera hydrothermalis TaxID=563188 RepID=UPI003340361F